MREFSPRSFSLTSGLLILLGVVLGVCVLAIANSYLLIMLLGKFLDREQVLAARGWAVPLAFFLAVAELILIALYRAWASQPKVESTKDGVRATPTHLFDVSDAGTTGGHQGGFPWKPVFATAAIVAAVLLMIRRNVPVSDGILPITPNNQSVEVAHIHSELDTEVTRGDKYTIRNGQKFTYKAEVTKARYAFCYAITGKGAIFLFKLKKQKADDQHLLAGQVADEFIGDRATEYMFFVLIATNEVSSVLETEPMKGELASWLTFQEAVEMQIGATRGENPEKALAIIRAALSRNGVANSTVRVECFQYGR